MIKREKSFCDCVINRIHPQRILITHTQLKPSQAFLYSWLNDFWEAPALLKLRVKIGARVLTYMDEVQTILLLQQLGLQENTRIPKPQSITYQSSNAHASIH